eukprot:g5915.t1
MIRQGALLVAVLIGMLAAPSWAQRGAQRGAELVWRWEVGSERAYRLIEQMLQTVSGERGDELSWRREITYVERVLSMDEDEVATVQREYTRVSVEVQSEHAGEARYDSEDPETHGDREKMLVAPFAELVGQSVTFRVTPGGEVLSAEGASAAWDAMLGGFGGGKIGELLSGGSMQDQSGRLARQIQDGLAMIPGRAVRRRESWSNDTTHATPIGRVRSELEHTYIGVKRSRWGRLARIQTEGEMSVVSEDEAPGLAGTLSRLAGIRVKLASSSVAGETLFDAERGCVAQQEMVVRMSWEIETDALGLEGLEGVGASSVQTMEQRGELELLDETGSIVGVLGVVLSLWSVRAVAGPSDVFKVNGRMPERGWVTFDETPPDPETSVSPMLARLNGVAATLDKDALRQLRRAARGAPKSEGDGERWWVVHLESRGEMATVEIGRYGDEWVARSLTSPGDEVRLRGRWFTELAAVWGAPRSERDALPEPGRVVDLEGAYVAGAVRLDRDVMADRYGATAGENAPLSGITRVLSEEQMWVRLPEGYDAGRPAGVMVWVSPTETWRLPPEFYPVLDELNLIACGFDRAGNFRKTRDGSTHGIVDRLQLMLDALQTTRSVFSVDDARVYITGFSGGGRVSSIMLCTYPEVFRGAVPIVGLDGYGPAYVAEGKYVPGRFPKPRGDRWKLLTQRRMWALSGSEDFNLIEMRVRVEAMEKDGLQVRLHSTPGHEHGDMPLEATVREAVVWVDEPAREAMEDGRRGWS